MKRPHDAYASVAFSGRLEGTALFADAVAHRIAQHACPRILDLGCGTGDLAIVLSQHFPHATIVGLDISPANIRAASERASSLPPERRPTFVLANYLQWSDGLFDFILADSVLHLIPGSTTDLAKKLADDLAPRGQLVATIPVAGAPNALRLLQRRAWRLMPEGFDRLALAIASRFHAGERLELLAERIPYLRVIPERMLDAEMLSSAKAVGLDQVERLQWPSPSVFKLRHELVTFARV